MIFESIIMYSMAFLFALSMRIRLNRKNDKIILNTSNIFLLGFLFVYALIFPLCYSLTYLGYNTKDMKEYILKYDALDIIIYYILASIICHIFISVFRKREKINELTKKRAENQGHNRHEQRIVLVSIVMLAIGIICDYLYMRPYGGYSNYLLYSGAIRSGVLTVNNPFSFLIVFRTCIQLSSFLFFSQIQKGNKNNHLVVFLFMISLFFSLRVLYANRGRLGFVVYIMIFLIYKLIYKKEHIVSSINRKMIRKVIILGFIFIGGLYFVGTLLSRNITDNIVTQINREISFIFVSFKAEFEGLDIERFRWFKDAILFPIYLLPTSIWLTRFGITTASSDNTLLLSGFRKGQGGIFGETPVDFLTISYMQAGIVGIIVIPIVYAILIEWIIRKTRNIENHYVQGILNVYVVVHLGLETIFYADPQHIIHRSFALIIFLLVEPFISKMKTKTFG